MIVSTIINCIIAQDTVHTVRLPGFLASVVYSAACAAVPRSQRAVATLLVNIGMTLGIWSGIGGATVLIQP
jgi:hypothetical protein